MLLSSTLFSSLPANADAVNVYSSPLTIEDKPLQVVEPDTVALSVHPLMINPSPAVNEAPVNVERVKPRFKVRHPRIYWTYRKGRHICIMVLPFLNVTAQCAQIITPFVI